MGVAKPATMKTPRRIILPRLKAFSERITKAAPKAFTKASETISPLEKTWFQNT